MAVAKGKRVTNAKQTAAKKGTARKPAAKKKSAAAIQKSKTFRNGVLGIGVIVLCLVILLCLVTTPKAAALEWIRGEFNGSFGALRFAFLFLLAVTGLKIAFGSRFPIRSTAFVTAVLLLVSIATLLQVFQKDPTEWALRNLDTLQKLGYQGDKELAANYNNYLWYAYTNSKVLGPSGGGVVGEVFGYPLGRVLDQVASALVLFFVIGALGVSLIRNLRPEAGAQMGAWFTQLSSDFREERARRQAEQSDAEEQRAQKQPNGTLVAIPEDLLHQTARNKTVSSPSMWQKAARAVSRAGAFFAPVVTSQMPPEDNAGERPVLHPLPEEQPAPPNPTIPSQIPAQMNAVHTQPVNRFQQQKPILRTTARQPYQPPQMKRQLYIEDIITSDQLVADVRPENATKSQKPYIRPVPSARNVRNQEQREFTVPDFLARRMKQYEEADPQSNADNGQTAERGAIEEIYASNMEAPEGSPIDSAAIFDEPEEPEIRIENESWEPMKAEYDPEDDLRPFRRRRNRAENPLDVLPKLDPDTRLDRPGWKPDEPASAPQMGFVSEIEEYRQPPFSLLLNEDKKKRPDTRLKDAEGAQKLEETLASFGVDARVIKVVHGPAITRYELQPAPGVKVSKIVNLTDDIALNMAAIGVRIEAPIPGKAAIGIEIANDEIETVQLRDVLESEESLSHPSRIAVALGKDVAGKRIVVDLARMPHLLIAGATGSGKSVCINTLITSIIYRANPEEVRLILIDPKKVELSLYNGIPHLLVPVVTNPKKASGALSWAVMEMDERYRLFSEMGVREIHSYNAQRSEDTPLMPQIIVIIDELADLMLVAPGEVEESINRLAQLARACGIHLVIATQRPSVNVITGVIKANIPARIAFAVSSQVDSRTILDAAGAEKLLGKGDMLYAPSGGLKPLRVQGCFISDEEVNRVVEYVKDRNTVDYSQAVIDALNVQAEEDAAPEESQNGVGDALFRQAVEMAVESGQASISMLQRRLRVGYARAGRLVDEMSRRGIIGAADGAKPREVLISREDFEGMYKKA